VNRDLFWAFLVIIFGATGTYLLMPHRHGSRKPRNVHAVGAGLGGLALLLFALLWAPPAPAPSGFGRFLSGLFFYGFGLAAVAGGVLTVTVRDPIHSALWFASVVLSTSGLFLQAGAQFLAAGTVIVYAGAIVVTFLFVIMLAQMEGRAPYDRAARMPFRATWTCFLLFFGVLWALLHVKDGTTAPAPTAGLLDPRLPRTAELALRTGNPSARAAVAEVVRRASRPTARLAAEGPDGKPQPKPHVAGLGETLYTDHLITVELAGALLFVALIGALAIAAPKPPVRPGSRQATPEAAARA
jgi:NADH-quinone oxidoreductase subunit J